MTIADSTASPHASDADSRVSGARSLPTGDRMLNVFALPAETEVRSFLLVTAALMLACVCALQFASLITWRLTPAPPEPLFTEIERILDSREAMSSSTRLAVALWMFSFFCFAIAKLIVVVAAIGLWRLLAWRLYREHPRRIRHRRQLVPLDAARDQRLLDFVSRVHASIPVTGVPPGPTCCPRVEIEADAIAGGAAEARAFGLDHEPVIALTNATRLEVRRDPALFAARILHELAHFAHHDVRADEAARAAWRALLVTGVFPMLGCLLLVFALFTRGHEDRGRSPLDMAATTTTQVAGTLALAWVAWVGLLRERETYADWRAAVWDADVREILTVRWSRPDDDAGWRGRHLFHPRPLRRRAILADPALLFAPRWMASLLTGVLAAFVHPLTFDISATVSELAAASFGSSVALVLLWVQEEPCFVIGFAGRWMMAIVAAVSGALASHVVAFLLPAGLTAWALGIQVQRASVATLAQPSRPSVRYAPLALLAAGGFELGLQLLPGSDRNYVPHDASSLGLVGLHFVALFGVLWLWMRGTHAATETILGGHAGARLPRHRRWALNVIGALSLLMAWAPLVALRTVASKVGAFERLPPAAIAATALIPSIVSLAAAGGLAIAATVLLPGLLAPPKCPHCTTVQIERRAVGRTCYKCGTPLDAWLWLSPVATATREDPPARASQP